MAYKTMHGITQFAISSHFLSKALDLAEMPVRGVYPNLGQIKRAKAHYYNDSDSMSFPPAGSALEVACYKIEMASIGKLARENLDVLFFAWLQRGFDVQQDGGQSELFAKFQASGNNVSMRINFRADVNKKTLQAYQHKENEEKNSEYQGHSVLSRSRELTSIQDALA
jgi:hypothetical protein